MTIRSQGRRKSTFPANTGIPDGATFDFVHGGVNYKIPIDAMQAALNVIGTIEQAGDPTAVPVLDIQASQHFIRNLETDSTSGLAASISALNGIRLALDAQTTGSGVPVLNPDNHIRRIKAGSGISVGASGDDIIVSLGVPGAGNVVVVSTLGDFPDPVAGVIPLAAGTVYFIQEIVDIGANRFSLASNTVMAGLSFVDTGIISTVTGALFTNSGGYMNEISQLNITAPTATVFDISGATGSFEGRNLFINSCASIATVSGVRSFRLIEVGAVSCTGNAYDFTSVTSIRLNDTAIFTVGGHFCTFAGTNGIALFTSLFVGGYTGTLFKLNAATFGRFYLGLVDAHSIIPANLFIDGAAASANITVGGVGVTENINITGTFTASVTILPGDIRWELAATSNNIKSGVTALLSMQGNATATVIVVAGTPVLVAGTWVVEHDSKMTGTVAGRATYDGPNDSDLPVVASISVEPVSGGAVTISAQIAVNGVVVAGSKHSASAAAGDPASIVLPWNLVFSTNDYIEIFVANETSTVNVLVSSAVLSAG